MSEVEIIRQRLLTFYRYYEETFYGYKWQRIAACLPVFHQLLHVADFLEDLGNNIYSAMVIKIRTHYN